MQNGKKRVFLEPLWKLRREYYDLAKSPPDGYEFVIQDTGGERLAKKLARRDTAYHVQHMLDRLLPLELAKPYWEKGKKLPQDVDLTYAILHPVFRNEPWILDMRLEQPHLLIGSERIFEIYRGWLRKALAAGNCKKVLCELEAGKKAFLQRLPWPELAEKTEVIYSAVPRRKFVKALSDDRKVKLLFVNSANINATTHFQTHGGLILIAAFRILQQKYTHLELVIRSGLPPGLKEELSGDPAIRVYDEVIPWEVLDSEFKTADIFVYPTHVTPSIVLLDAMSYELPIVTTDVWGNPELVQDGETGLLVHHPGAARFTDGFIVHFDSREFRSAIASIDPELVRTTADKVALLIEDRGFRRRLGTAARFEVEEGKFSPRVRNERLKRILDEATGSG